MIRLDPERRQEAIEAGWTAYQERTPDMREAYLQACEEWQVIAVVADGVIGALFAKDGLIHLGIVPEWRGRWASRRLIREMLSYGTATTLLPDEHECADFVRRIGFERKSDELCWRYRNSPNRQEVQRQRLFVQVVPIEHSTVGRILFP